MSNFPDFSSYGYQVQEILGQNPQGGRVTYLAKRQETGKLVVIKEFQFANTATDWSGYKAYKREIDVLRSLDHPGIPKYIDALQTETGFCMVQEHKPAQSLAQFNQLEPQQVKQIAIEVLKILIYLQQRLPVVIHRDIKPENILLGENQQVYLVDFGFARLGGGDLVALSSVVVGTPGFMPPEQLLNLQITPASDLYSLGATLICLLTGKKSTEISSLIDNSFRINFQDSLPKVGWRFTAWLERLVEPNLEKRFPDAQSALVALEPLYVSTDARIKVYFSPPTLQFKPQGEEMFLTRTVQVINDDPFSNLEAYWEIDPCPQDAPYPEGKHPWLRVQPSRFIGNQTECQVVVHLRRLRLNEVYRRKLLLHTNGVPETIPFPISVHTAKVADCAPLPVAPILKLLIVVSFCVYLGAEIGVQMSLDSLGAISGGFLTGIIAKLFIGQERQDPDKPNYSAVMLIALGFCSLYLGLLNLGDIGFANIFFFLFPIGLGIAQLVLGREPFLFLHRFLTRFRRNLPQLFARRLEGLTIALATCFGIIPELGFSHPFVWLSLAIVGIPWLTIIGQYSWQRRRSLAAYRRSDENLIEP